MALMADRVDTVRLGDPELQLSQPLICLLSPPLGPLVHLSVRCDVRPLVHLTVRLVGWALACKLGGGRQGGQFRGGHLRDRLDASVGRRLFQSIQYPVTR